MSLLSDLMQESAAGGSTGAGSVAGARGLLFGGSPKDLAKENHRKTKMLRRIGYKIIGESAKTQSLTKSLLRNKRWQSIAESAFEDEYDHADVISKLDAAEEQANNNDDTVCFGMEDEDGTLVKVYVRSDQSEDFEHALATMLSGADEDADDDNSHGEIAEVLYNLKDKFEIIDVDWGTIEGDEEEEQEVADGEAPEGEAPEGEDPAAGDTQIGGGDAGAVMGGPPAGGEGDASSALQSVIAMMQADAEAKKAEAEARKAEAEAKIGKHANAAAESKVQQQEEILDMETAEKTEKDAQKEAKTLAKLAKYRHTIRGNGNVADAAPTEEPSLDVGTEEEEESGNTGEVSKEELAALLFKHLASN